MDRIVRESWCRPKFQQKVKIPIVKWSFVAIKNKSFQAGNVPGRGRLGLACCAGDWFSPA